MAEEELLTVEETARRLRLSQETIRRWLREKRIRGIRLATARAGWRIPASAVAEMLSEGRQIPLPEADQKKAAA
jgi:excisionase family DNA binding protein